MNLLSLDKAVFIALSTTYGASSEKSFVWLCASLISMFDILYNSASLKPRTLVFHLNSSSDCFALVSLCHSPFFEPLRISARVVSYFGASPEILGKKEMEMYTPALYGICFNTVLPLYFTSNLGGWVIKLDNVYNNPQEIRSSGLQPSH
jgi:hypothetical protein